MSGYPPYLQLPNDEHRLVGAAQVSTQPASQFIPLPPLPVPPDGGFVSHSVVTPNAPCYCLALLKGTAVGFCSILRRLTIGVLYVFTWSSISHKFCYQSTIPISYLQLCGKLFCNERSSWGIEQHLIKSMFVFCLISSLHFLTLSLGI